MTDILMDTGPLVAIVNRGDTHHQQCAELLRSLSVPFYTTLQVLTETLYLAGSRLGWPAQQAVWKMVLRGDLLLEPTSPQELVRMAELMEKYRDHPMDSADASLVALAERLSVTRIFTLDVNDFSTYRMNDNRSFIILGPKSKSA
jgi:predicted nucleic acid-binding protein